MVTLASSTPEADRKVFGKSAAKQQSETQLREVQLHLIQKLQTSLNLPDLLRLFFDALRGFTGVHGMEYRYDEAGVHHSFGETRAHKADYRINTQTHQLGSISFYRPQRFVEAELIALEILIGNLFYPLRNALLYLEALRSSLRDPLTQVGNRAALTRALQREMEVAKRYNRPLCMMLIDIDHFKAINDTIGHAAGDAVIQHVAEKVGSDLRQIDEIFRYGGEEFVVLLSNTDSKAAGLVAERIRQSLQQQPFRVNEETVELTVSIGLSLYQADDTEESLFDRADQALYLAKGAGRNRVEYADG
jgi:diguanylate cyclase (GGDEF)-like protein